MLGTAGLLLLLLLALVGTILSWPCNMLLYSHLGFSGGAADAGKS
jgi:hypothetical protein